MVRMKTGRSGFVLRKISWWYSPLDCACVFHPAVWTGLAEQTRQQSDQKSHRPHNVHRVVFPTIDQRIMLPGLAISLSFINCFECIHFYLQRLVSKWFCGSASFDATLIYLQQGVGRKTPKCCLGVLSGTKRQVTALLDYHQHTRKVGLVSYPESIIEGVNLDISVRFCSLFWQESSETRFFDPHQMFSN